MGRNMKIVAVKTYYQPQDVVEMLDMQEAELIRFARGVGALRKVKNVRLINLPIFMEYLEKYQALMKEPQGTFLEMEDAVEKTGLPPQVIEKIGAIAGALYQVGTFRIIDVKKLEEYIRKFPVACPEEPEEKKIRGSRFVREICRRSEE